jgi:predicted HTH domain antitoxin
MTDQQIIDLFDSTNITLSELSAISGRSVADLKQLLIAQDADSYRYGG